MRKRRQINPFVDISAREANNEDDSDLSDVSDLPVHDDLEAADLDASGPSLHQALMNNDEEEDLDAVVVGLKERAKV